MGRGNGAAEQGPTITPSTLAAREDCILERKRAETARPKTATSRPTRVAVDAIIWASDPLSLATEPTNMTRCKSVEFACADEIEKYIRK